MSLVNSDKIYGHLLGTADSLEKTLMLGKIEGRRRRPLRMLLAASDKMPDHTGLHNKELYHLTELEVRK